MYGILENGFVKDTRSRSICWIILSQSSFCEKCVNGDRCYRMKIEFLRPELMNLEYIWFLQDGAHFRDDIIDFMRQKFPGRITSRNGGIIQPPKYFDLISLCYFLCEDVERQSGRLVGYRGRNRYWQLHGHTSFLLDDSYE